MMATITPYIATASQKITLTNKSFKTLHKIQSIWKMRKIRIINNDIYASVVYYEPLTWHLLTNIVHKHIKSRLEEFPILTTPEPYISVLSSRHPVQTFHICNFKRSLIKGWTRLQKKVQEDGRDYNEIVDHMKLRHRITTPNESMLSTELCNHGKIFIRLKKKQCNHHFFSLSNSCIIGWQSTKWLLFAKQTDINDRTHWLIKLTVLNQTTITPLEQKQPL